jgi:hypothetical protein
MVAKESKPKRPRAKRAPKPDVKKVRKRNQPQEAEAAGGLHFPGSEAINRRTAERAYFLFQERGCEHGRDLEDWLNAEAMVLRELG